MAYLKRTRFDTETEYIEPFYYYKQTITGVSSIDDVMVDMSRPFVCPDCSGTFLYSMDHLKDRHLANLYSCNSCKSVFTMSK